ncbi:hypothetical protein, partial [Burkholderia multivorans]|uniref:hypothetical protein n=1 Tax=Burkholderia multivorans TaxID=87883 RepID=UPI001C6122C8
VVFAGIGADAEVRLSIQGWGGMAVMRDACEAVGASCYRQASPDSLAKVGLGAVPRAVASTRACAADAEQADSSVRIELRTPPFLTRARHPIASRPSIMQNRTLRVPRQARHDRSDRCSRPPCVR